jgi:hypothetical protein
MRDALLLNWDNAGSIAVPAFVASATNGGFVAEGDPIPVRQFANTAAILQPYKVASISALSREMIESSNAEALITDALVRSAALAIDAAFFDATAANAARPAGILNGIAATGASNNAELSEAFADDMEDLINSVAQVGGNGPYYIVGRAGRIFMMAIRFATAYTNDKSIRLAISGALAAQIVAVAPKGIAAAIEPDPEIETASAGTLVMDTAPVTPDTTQTTKSLFQTDSIAVKVRWPVSWVVRNPQAVAWLTPTWK